jgi:uncharacterized protein
MLQCNDSTSTIKDFRVKIEREQAQGKNLFTGYGEGYVAVNGARYTASLVVSGDRLVTDWPAHSVQSMVPGDLAAILELKPEVLLLGSGAHFAFPDPAVLAPVYQAGIGVEVMDTPAACRTYNILLGEGRNVVAALVL